MPIEKRLISLKFDNGLDITAERLFVRDRPDWLGPKTRLGSEVPDPDCVPAAVLLDGWRQCSACADAFEAKPSEVYAVCPACGRMTEFVEGTAEEAQKGASTPAEDSRIRPLKSPPRFRSK